ncbi:Immune-related Hdd13 [Operophtera brumata]|uniref:Immune-related Hdd13 n=1 Tax=Operophtera brumata TaxID=104452 RepID=A0A0L7LDI1_OPEBR|nr:Immune-related Hdd13 [Operophtera brumata]
MTVACKYVQENRAKRAVSRACRGDVHPGRDPRARRQEVEEHSKTTHHYCDVFTEQVLAPLGELAYVRVDENTAEKVAILSHHVFINRNKSILIISSDGMLAQWRCAPTFESTNMYIAGTPIVSARQLVYGDRTFPSREALREFVAALPPGAASPPGAAVDFTPVLHLAPAPRVSLVADSGRQIAHNILQGVIVKDIEYL